MVRMLALRQEAVNINVGRQSAVRGLMLMLRLIVAGGPDPESTNDF